MNTINLSNINNIYNLGDVHLGIKSNSLEWLNIQKDYILNDFINDIDKRGFNENTDILIQYGDWHHSRESINSRIYNSSIEILEKLCYKFKRGVYIFLGNHDVYYKDNNNIHSLIGLSKMFDNLHIIIDPTIMSINNKHKILILPWNSNNNELSQIIYNNSNNCDYIMCHADIYGAKLNKFTEVSTGIDLDILKSYKKVYAGHIHIQQQYSNVLYIGTPYEMDRGDRYTKKGYWIFNTESDNFNEVFIENMSSPRFIKIDILDLLNMKLNEATKLLNNNFIDIMIDTNIIDNIDFSKILEVFSESNYRTIEFIEYSKDSYEISNDENLELVDVSFHSALNEIIKDKEYLEEEKEFILNYFENLHKKVSQ